MKHKCPSPRIGKKPRGNIGRWLYAAFLTATLSASLCQPASAATVWEKANEIMRDVYTQILGISTIAAIVTAAVALLMMNFSRSGRTVDESRAWLKRIIITWAVLNGLGFIMSYVTPFFSGGQWTGPVKAMGILDGIVEWIAEQIMYGLDMINTSVLGALGCDMNTFLRYFPAAETMYSLLVALAIGLILLGWVWNLFKNYGLGLGVDAEDPVKLTAKAILFIVLAYYADEIVNIALTIGGTPYAWILSSELPSLDFASFNSVLLTIIGVCANGGVALIVLILTLILAWNYIKLLFEAAERYVLLGVLVYTAPVAFAMGASQSTANIFKSWCRMFGGQIFLLLMNAWCLRLFITMVGTFISNPLSM